MIFPPDQIMKAHLGGEEWFGLCMGAFLGSAAVLAGLANAFVYLRGGPDLQKVKGGPRGALSSAILGVLFGSYFIWVSMIYIRPRAEQDVLRYQKDDLQTYLSANIVDLPPQLFLQYVKVGAVGINDDVDNGPALANYLNVGNREAARQLIEAGASVDARESGGGTPLLTAVDDDDPETVKFLLSAHANPNLAADNLPIFGAVNPDPDPATQKSSDRPSDGDETPPISITTHHRRETTQALVAAGAKLDVRDERSYTPLMIAAASGQCDIVAALLPGHPDLALRDDSGMTALDWAKQDHPECAPLLHGTSGSEAAAANLLTHTQVGPADIPERIRENQRLRADQKEERARNLAQEKKIDREMHPFGIFTGVAGQLFWSLVLSTIVYGFHRIRSLIRGDRQPVHWSWLPVMFGSSSSFGNDSSFESSSGSEGPSKGGGASGGAGAGGDF